MSYPYGTILGAQILTDQSWPVAPSPDNDTPESYQGKHAHTPGRHATPWRPGTVVCVNTVHGAHPHTFNMLCEMPFPV